MMFRIWNKNMQKFVSPEEYYINGNGEVFYHDIMDGELVKCKDCIIQRFTGLLDIDNIPIYEGDILINPSKGEESYSEDLIVKYGFGRWTLSDMEDLDDYWVDNHSNGDITSLKKINSILEKIE